MPHPAWTVWTLPIAPSQTHSQSVRIESVEWPWFPSCEMTFFSRAAFTRARTSAIEWAMGFSQ